MIVADTSAMVAIIEDEPERALFLEVLSRSGSVLPVSCYLEAVMVLTRRPGGRAALDGVLDRLGMTILGSDAVQAQIAADAFERYGRGSGHPARLNFGDCLAYAAAAASRAPLLYKGDDFARTDLAAGA